MIKIMETVKVKANGKAKIQVKVGRKLKVNVNAKARVEVLIYLMYERSIFISYTWSHCEPI